MANLMRNREDLEKSCNEQRSEFDKQLGRIKENHDVEVYKLKESFEKIIK